MQRAVDEVIHDVCLQKLPVVFALDRAGLVGSDGETHQGLYDISLFRSFPDMTILAPAGEAELIMMLDWAFDCSGPAIIRYPKAVCPAGRFEFSQPLEKGRGILIERPFDGLSAGPGGFSAAGVKEVCIAFTGSLYTQVLEAAELLESRGIGVDLYNLRFLKPVDEAYLAELMNSYETFVFVEEGSRSGGFGEYALELALRMNCSCRSMALGVKEKIDEMGTREERLCRNDLNSEGIAEAIERYIKKKKKKDYPVMAGSNNGMVI
jgi:1-deoxy-D-xylulose-5-phosphate synthase